MKVELRSLGRVQVLDMEGRMSLERSVLREQIRELLDGGGRAFVFNMERVPYADSIGLGELVVCQKRIVERGGQLRLVVSPKLRQLFQLTGIDRALDVHPDLEAALASLGS